MKCNLNSGSLVKVLWYCTNAKEQFCTSQIDGVWNLMLAGRRQDECVEVGAISAMCGEKKRVKLQKLDMFTHSFVDRFILMSVSAGIKLTLSALIDGKNINAGGHKLGLGLEFQA